VRELPAQSPLTPSLPTPSLPAQPKLTGPQSPDGRRRIVWGQLLLAAAAGFLLAMLVFRPWQSRQQPAPQAAVQARPPRRTDQDGPRRAALPAVARLAVATGPVEMRSPSQSKWHVLP